MERINNRRGNKVYRQVLLRESYREPGAPRSRVKHRTLLNLTKYDPKDIAAIEMALKHKNDLKKLKEASQAKVEVKQERSVGAVWALWRVAQRTGLASALGGSQEGRRVLWQVFARLINQGSRLSAVRLVKEHAACEVLGLESFNEDRLYESLDWLDARQSKIEDKLFKKRENDDANSQLFLYDVTSSYLEGTENDYAAYGYNFIVMLAYLLRRELAHAWREFDVTVEEGLSLLGTLCAQEVRIGGEAGCLSVPEPRPSLARLFDALNIKPPTTLPRSQAHVATKRNLPSRRKTT
ncbi:MAG: hypothetical protein R6V10_07670 [bacterium]